MHTFLSTDQEQAEMRAAYVSGLRQLANLVEAHPELPLPVAGGNNAFVSTKDELAAVARVGGVKWAKSANGDYFYLQVAFDGGHTYDVNIQRDQVCTKTVIGTRVVPAVPEHDEEIVRWECDSPLLAGVK